ncbi:MAG: hypothetical protein R2834_11365 [Rhodothermales bacterium]
MATSGRRHRDRLSDDAAEDSFDLIVLRGDAATSARTSAIHHSSEGVFAIRQGPWKLIEGLGSGGFSAPKFETPVPGGPTGQLYNLDEDLGETRNRYLDEPATVAPGSRPCWTPSERPAGSR